MRKPSQRTAKAIRSTPGQKFLRELVASLDALPDPALIFGELWSPCGVCALGAVALKRGLNPALIDPINCAPMSEVLGIVPDLACEIADVNDDDGAAYETFAERFTRVRAWAIANIKIECGDSQR